MVQFSKKQEIALLAIIIILAVFARLYSLAVFPDAGLNDSIMHLYLAKGLSTGSEPIVSMPPPLQHFALASVFSFAGLDWSNGFFLKIMPFALSILFLAGCFILFRKFFGNNYLLPFAFVAVNPWLILYFAINYTEAFVATAVVFCALFSMRFFEKPNVANSLFLGLSVSALAISKLNGTVLAGVFFISIIAVSLFCRKEIFSEKKPAVPLIVFAVYSLLFPLVWFVMQKFRDGFFILPNVSENFFVYSLPQTTSPIIMFAKSIFFSIINFWGYPAASMAEKAIPKSLILLSMLLFFILVVLLSIAVIYGFFAMLKKTEKKPFFILIFVVIGANLLFIIFHGNPFLIGESLYWRYFIPVIPLLAISFALGFDFFAKNRRIQSIALACFFLFALFSVSYSVVFSTYFQEVHGGYESLYSYLDLLPEGSAVFSSDLGRQISFFSKTPMCKASTWNSNLNEDPKAIVFHSVPEEAARIMKTGGCTHLIITAYREAWKPEQVKAMLDAGVLEKTFEKESFTVYKINSK